MEYPERRPYATTVSRSGYLAKPQQALAPLPPAPPTEALRILSSHAGYDRVRPRPNTAGRLPAIGGCGSDDATEASELAAQRAAADRFTLPDANRSAAAALSAARLEDPFSHAASTYHSSQQGALNAELRRRVEKLLEAWRGKLAQLSELVDHYPADNAMVNYSGAEAIKAYIDVYRCTEDLTVPVASIPDKYSLTTQLGELEQVEAIPILPLENIRRSLDSLLTSRYLLAPLEPYVDSLAVYDELLAQLPEDQRVAAGGALGGCARAMEDGSGADDEGESDRSTGSNGINSGSSVASSLVIVRQGSGGEQLVCASTTAVALHERLHYDPGTYALSELHKSEAPLLDMERRVEESRRRKESAIDAIDPVDALRCLHAQVDFSNDLLLLNKARMGLVRMHNDDVRALRLRVSAAIADAKQTAELLQGRVADLQPRIRQDVATLASELDKSRAAICEMDAREAVAEAEVRAELKAQDEAERQLWDQMRSIARQLVESSEVKQRSAQARLSQRERRAREQLAAAELEKAQEQHWQRLVQCGDLVERWELGGAVYAKYVEAFVPKLLKRVNALEEADEDLSNREAQDYVRRFEMFAYSAEEARAKRCVQADRMRLVQRSALLNKAEAGETLDPQPDQHDQRFDQAGQELAEVTAYVEYICGIEEERRAEVEPVLMKVMAHNATVQRELLAVTGNNTSGNNGSTGSRSSSPEPAAQAAVAAASSSSITRGGSSGRRSKRDSSDATTTTTVAVVAAATAGPADSVLAATMAHPYVTASRIAIAHEEAYVAKHRRLNEEELMAQEGKLDGVRRSKNELAAMAAKFKNADYVREMLLGNGVNRNEL